MLWHDLEKMPEEVLVRQKFQVIADSKLMEDERSRVTTVNLPPGNSWISWWLKETDVRLIDLLFTYICLHPKGHFCCFHKVNWVVLLAHQFIPPFTLAFDNFIYLFIAALDVRHKNQPTIFVNWNDFCRSNAIFWLFFLAISRLCVR